MLDKTLVAALLFSVCTLPLASTLKSTSVDDIFDLSLDDLVNLKITTGSLLSSSSDKSPAAVTVISRDQITLSGAKNLAHLMEQHVPGMILMAHSEGEKIGLRGTSLLRTTNYCYS